MYCPNLIIQSRNGSWKESELTLGDVQVPTSTAESTVTRTRLPLQSLPTSPSAVPARPPPGFLSGPQTLTHCHSPADNIFAALHSAWNCHSFPASTSQSRSLPPPWAVSLPLRTPPLPPPPRQPPHPLISPVLQPPPPTPPPPTPTPPLQLLSLPHSGMHPATTNDLLTLNFLRARSMPGSPALSLSDAAAGTIHAWQVFVD